MTEQELFSAMTLENAEWNVYGSQRAAVAVMAASIAEAVERARWESALKQTWQAIDPIRPAGHPGSYARGYDNGFAAALGVLRGNLKA